MFWDLILKIYHYFINNPDRSIAILAFIATFLGAHYSRQHNKLSVRPFISIWQGTSEDETGLAQCKLQVMNNGLGPAIIKTFNIFFDKKHIGSTSNPEVLINKIAEKLGAHDSYCNIRYNFLSPDSIIAAGESVDFLVLNLLEENIVAEKHLDEFINKFDLKISYKSMYGVKYNFDLLHTKIISRIANIFTCKKTSI